MRNLPVCCSPNAFQALRVEIPTLETPGTLTRAAVAIASHWMSGAASRWQWVDVDSQLEAYADEVRNRVSGSQPQAVLAWLHEVLFEHHGFVGNDSERHWEPENNFLPAVLERKCGGPAVLSMIYADVARRLGVGAHGVALPGHFMVSCDDGSPMLIDPFGKGRQITRGEADAKLKEMFGADAVLRDDMLSPTSTRQWLTRIMQNLLNIFGAGGRYTDAAAVLEMEMLLWPDQIHLQRDLALILARCGLSAPAFDFLDAYLATDPVDPQKTQLFDLLRVLA